jgi:hypothetical protein
VSKCCTVSKWLRESQYFSKSPICSALWTDHVEVTALPATFLSPAAQFCNTPTSHINHRHLFKREKAFAFQKVKLEMYTKKIIFIFSASLKETFFFLQVYFSTDSFRTLIFTLIFNVSLNIYNAAYYRTFSWNFTVLSCAHIIISSKHILFFSTGT